jgi:hypothetical protein
VNIMTTEFAKLRRIALDADLVASIVEMKGDFAQLLTREMGCYPGSAEGLARRLRRLPPEELRNAFGRDFFVLTGLELE